MSRNSSRPSEVVLYRPGDHEDEGHKEPPFEGEDLRYYRELVSRMTEEAQIIPGLETVTELLIRSLARDWVASTMLDDAGDLTARAQIEISKRMDQRFKQLMNLALKADLRSAISLAYLKDQLQHIWRALGIIQDQDFQELPPEEQMVKLGKMLQLSLRAQHEDFSKRYF